MVDFSLNEIDFEEEVEGTATNLAFSSGSLIYLLITSIVCHYRNFCDLVFPVHMDAVFSKKTVNVDDYRIIASNGIGIRMLKFCLDMRQMEKRRMVPET
jgi:hypothetical protein